MSWSKKKTWIFSGIGATLIGVLLSFLLGGGDGNSISGNNNVMINGDDNRVTTDQKRDAK
jgi:hypothetical protein